MIKEILIFVGYSSDAKEEALAIRALESDLQKYLGNDPQYHKIKIFNWEYDAKLGTGGQKHAVDPFIKKANIAVFIFKERVGAGTWEELTSLRDREEDKRIPVIALFPDEPPDNSKFKDADFAANWADLLKKKKELTKGWFEPFSKAITPVQPYKDISHLNKLALKLLQELVTSIVEKHKEQTAKTDKPDEANEAKKATEAKSDIDFEKEIQTYGKKAKTLHEYLPVAGFASHIKVPIDIEDIYIPLRAMLNLSCFDDIRIYGDACEAEKYLARHDAALEIPLLNAFGEAEKRGRKALVILGDPGSGKTTHLKRILLWCLLKDLETMGLEPDILPVFLPLRELTKPDKSLADFIQNQLAGIHLKMLPDFGQRLMNRGKLLFLLDGLDEVADLAQREQVSKWIEEAFKDYPDCRFVVTCRFAGYSPSVRLSEKFMEMHVRPLSEQDAESFVHKWYAIVEKNQAKDVEQAASIAKEKAENLIERLSQPDFRARRVFELTRNPLLLTNICLVHRHRGTLPQRRARLYEECIDVLLEHWRESKKLNIGVNALEGRQVLQPAALWMHKEKGRTRAGAEELAPIIDPVLKKINWENGNAHKFLQLIRDESGLLTGWDQEHYGFMHLGFQEYLAAREIRSRFLQEINEQAKSGLLKELAQNFADSWWQEVALLLLSLEDPPLFVPYMRELVKLPAFAQNSDMLEMCLDDTIQTSPLPFIELLKENPAGNKNLWEAQLLALKIVERLDKDALKPIIALLQKHPDQRIRQWVQQKFREKTQNVIRPEPSEYELVFIKGGSFMMGSKDPEARDNEEPIHEVTLSNFYMGRYPVTNEEYARFIKATNYNEPKYWGDRKYNQPRQPVVGVTWEDTKAFARWAGLQLPSEAQWEYAARSGGKDQKYAGGDDIDKVAWYRGNSEGRLHVVGEKAPNDLGLYDMSGNVWEWCEDVYDERAYEKHELNNPVITSGRTYRVIRGGGWLNIPGDVRAAYRYRISADYRNLSLGFRLCLSQVRQ
jgi:formylglycine-generating enzyme required for sulfatase activity